ncbi:MAG: exopolysaccharide biosynthesis polyprenyl glycosylphosphotransferase [Patescibacteria group bacterium]
MPDKSMQDMKMKGLLIQFKMFFIFIVDLAVAFSALFLMILIRYGSENFSAQLKDHFIPFSIITLLFILIFFIFNLYSFRFNKNTTEFANSFAKSLMISFSISVLIFYIFGDFFKLTPKTNLVIFTGIFGILDFYLRILIKRYFTHRKINRKIIIISKKRDGLVEELRRNQNIGYEIIRESDMLDLNEIIALDPDIVVISGDEGAEFNKIYALVKKGIFVYTINNFYEEMFQKMPTEILGKNEIIEYISENKTIFNFMKRILDIALSFALIILLSPVFVLTAIIVKLTSKGPALFKHQRISLNDTEFTIYKFRSMYLNSEKNGAVWTKDNKKDSRITPVGKFIRETHLDEIPQLINILKGDISFVGPRPERPEFIRNLKQDILYYDLRHTVKGGLTGWAQVNYKYGSSTEDAREKLKYDFYYIKNRNIFFDIIIILKTIAKIFTY